jgi:hypothetical protein
MDRSFVPVTGLAILPPRPLLRVGPHVWGSALHIQFFVTHFARCSGSQMLCICCWMDCAVAVCRFVTGTWSVHQRRMLQTTRISKLFLFTFWNIPELTLCHNYCFWTLAKMCMDDVQNQENSVIIPSSDLITAMIALSVVWNLFRTRSWPTILRLPAC